MSIDIRTLHIGSHINVNGERVRVFGIGNNAIFYLPSIVSSVCKEVKVEQIESIAITPDLLKELGFKKIAEHGNWSDWKNYDGIGIGFVGERISATINSTENVVAVANIRYLHELEAYVYLATQKEPIED